LELSAQIFNRKKQQQRKYTICIDKSKKVKCISICKVCRRKINIGNYSLRNKFLFFLLL